MQRLIDCVTVTKNTPERPIFIVGGLSFDAHKAGFVVLNPQFKATKAQVETGAAHLTEYLRGQKNAS